MLILGFGAFLPGLLVWFAMHGEYQLSEPHLANYRIENYQPTNSLYPMIEKLYVTDTSALRPAVVQLSPWWTINATTKEFPIGHTYDGFWIGNNKEDAYLLELYLYPSDTWPGWVIGLICLVIFISSEVLLFVDVMLLLHCTRDDPPATYAPVNPPQPPTSEPATAYAPVNPSEPPTAYTPVNPSEPATAYTPINPSELLTESPTPTPFADPTILVELAEPSPTNR